MSPLKKEENWRLVGGGDFPEISQRPGNLAPTSMLPKRENLSQHCLQIKARQGFASLPVSLPDLAIKDALTGGDRLWGMKVSPPAIGLWRISTHKRGLQSRIQPTAGPMGLFSPRSLSAGAGVTRHSWGLRHRSIFPDLAHPAKGFRLCDKVNSCPNVRSIFSFHTDQHQPGLILIHLFLLTLTALL